MKTTSKDVVGTDATREPDREENPHEPNGDCCCGSLGRDRCHAAWRRRRKVFSGPKTSRAPTCWARSRCSATATDDKSDLFLHGTPIAENAQGSARVEYQKGNAQISAKVKNLPKPASLGPYTTFVLWALTPDGRASNMGVLAGAEGGKGEIDTQYNASQFALIVTAEPHFAVSVPSTMIAMYNVADNVEGAAESKVTTLTERADYSQAHGNRDR